MRKQNKKKNTPELSTMHKASHDPCTSVNYGQKSKMLWSNLPSISIKRLSKKVKAGLFLLETKVISKCLLLSESILSVKKLIFFYVPLVQVPTIANIHIQTTSLTSVLLKRRQPGSLTEKDPLEKTCGLLVSQKPFCGPWARAPKAITAQLGNDVQITLIG